MSYRQTDFFGPKDFAEAAYLDALERDDDRERPDMPERFGDPEQFEEADEPEAPVHVSVHCPGCGYLARTNLGGGRCRRCGEAMP